MPLRWTDRTFDFTTPVSRFVERLDAWPPDRWGQAALHPRLNQPMRVIDMAFFVAEHDDHHLAVMTDLVRHATISRASAGKS